jgi:hypothetical protein
MILVVMANFAFGQHKPDRIFKASKGDWPVPIDNVKEIITYNEKIKPMRACAVNQSISFISKEPGVVRSVFSGKVVRVFRLEDCGVILVRYGSYFIAYTNLKDIFVNQNDSIKQHQTIGTMLPSYPNLYEVEIDLMARKPRYLDPEPWFGFRLDKYSRRKFGN